MDLAVMAAIVEGAKVAAVVDGIGRYGTGGGGGKAPTAAAEPKRLKSIWPKSAAM